MDVKLPPSDARNLRETFFELLQDFSTFPAAQNFFLVSIDNLPASINDEAIKKLGLRPFNTKPGIDTNRKVHEKFFGKGGGYMFLATGVDTTTEHNTVQNRGKTINGILPTGPFMESHDYPDNDLDVQFYETNVSVIDGIFRPWAQLYGVYGNIDKPVLTANIDIFFLSKQMVTSRKTSFMSMLFGSPGSSSPVVRKIYKYKDCIPYQINDAGVNEYTGEMDTGSISVKWRFSRYEVLTPYVEAAPPPPPAPAPAPEPGKYNLAKDRTKGNWDDDIWTAEVPPSPSAKKPDAKSKGVYEVNGKSTLIGPGDVMTPEQKSKIGHQTGHLVKRTGKSEGAFMGPGDDPSFFKSDKFNPSKPTPPAATPPLSKGNYAVPGPSIHEQQATRVRVQAKRTQDKMDLEHGKKVRQTEEQSGPNAPGPAPGP